MLLKQVLCNVWKTTERHQCQNMTMEVFETRIITNFENLISANLERTNFEIKILLQCSSKYLTYIIKLCMIKYVKHLKYLHKCTNN